MSVPRISIRPPSRPAVCSSSIMASEYASCPVETPAHQIDKRRRPPSCRSLYSRKRPIKSKARSEEHTSELQSLMRISYAVFCLKKKKKKNTTNTKQQDKK